ncbi:hypothetical protein Dda_5477 [Drechslerella dactyloides]|uniref:Uncharacterized protein n=1 Tax=Drechslerella dactyloides TaxID=74499 RepID=A0AAD6IW59_DREDA|nr:hypothetical protein Dda_5477 [Drechslerella dactyloides]
MSASTWTPRIGACCKLVRAQRRTISCYPPRREFGKWSAAAAAPDVGKPGVSNVGDVRDSESEGSPQDAQAEGEQSQRQWRIHRTTPDPQSNTGSSQPGTPNLVGRMVPTAAGGPPTMRLVHPLRPPPINFTAPQDHKEPGNSSNIHPLRKPDDASPAPKPEIKGLPKIKFKSASFHGPANSPLQLNEFLNEYVPSKSKGDVIGPWIWVTKDKQRHGLPKTAWANRTSITNAQYVLNKEYDATIKARKKWPDDQTRMSAWDETMERVKEPIREIAESYDYTAGGWFTTVSGAYADSMFRAIARNLIAGPLKNSPATAVKVSTQLLPNLKSDVHVLTVLQENIYDKKATGQVLEMLIRLHGFLPTGAKPDIYFQIGLGHLHRSRGHASVYLPFDFFSMDEIQNMAPKNSLAQVNYRSTW